ncbi:Na+/H+ antiporter subunit E [Treponema sp. J25]|jgi:multicomponent Na+:H+ antiporter subunit E|uniref:Na+/H+ antiporter subunit E n=1 Tax=Treponema sp. J25 TaxID=2094121 RepID=UPI0010498DE5|nr:Na+/H+ antiporter subunit E [Treponema sp. J25]TCW62412.1 cation:proton antiporter [Treponema sp. J25]
MNKLVRLRWNIIRVTITTIFLFSLWLLFSASLEPYHMIVGFAGSSVVALFTYRVFIEDWEAGKHSVVPRGIPLLGYLFCMVWWLYTASFAVARAVITGKVQPRIVYFRSKLRSDLARVVLAHSITFTPGTMVLELDEDHYVVHWLFATSRHSKEAGDQIKGKMEGLLRRVWV